MYFLIVRAEYRPYGQESCGENKKGVGVWGQDDGREAADSADNSGVESQGGGEGTADENGNMVCGPRNAAGRNLTARESVTGGDRFLYLCCVQSDLGRQNCARNGKNSSSTAIREKEAGAA